MKNIYCVRPIGFNIGNELIYLCARYFLKRILGNDCNFINFAATNEYESHNKAGFTSATVYEFNNFADAVVIIGGNIFENGKLDINLDAFQKLEIPLFVFSVSRGRVYGRNNKLTVRTDVMSDKSIEVIANKSVAILSRDLSTYAHLKEIAPESPNILGACPTLFLNEVISAHKGILPPKNNTIYLSIRTPDLISIPSAKRSQIFDDIRETIKRLQKQNEQVKILCHDHRDIPFAASFVGVEYAYTEDILEFVGMLQSAKAVITYRLHSALPCFSIGTPFINISYDERSLSMMETIGMSDWNINMMESQDVPTEILNRFKSISTLKESALQRVKKMNEFKEKIEQALHVLKSKIN